jgi:hypothetical protein
VKHLLAVLLAVLLTGCAYVPPVPVRDDVRIVLRAHNHPTAWGTATYLPAWNLCIITLREYLQCLLHEIRHCFEGQWHPGRDTVEDC